MTTRAQVTSIVDELLDEGAAVLASINGFSTGYRPQAVGEARQL